MITSGLQSGHMEYGSLSLSHLICCYVFSPAILKRVIIRIIYA